MRVILTVSLILLAGGCWMDDFASSTDQNQRALDAYERGDAVENYAQAQGKGEAQQAVESYYADHGRYPATLQDLVPEYVTRVPRQADGTPFTYNPETGTVSE